MLIYKEIVGIAWIVFVVVWVISAASAKRSVKGNFFRFAPARVAIVFACLAAFRHSGHGLREGITNPEFALTGLVLCTVGIGLAFWARFHIGRNWGAPMSLKKDPELVTSGPYTFIRHPIYTGVLTALIGTAIVEGYAWFIAVAVAFVYFIYSAITEEKNMTAQFPEAYPAYRQRSKMLIPFVF
jgi:protein-S-isoprenylcysteine O-methyltransferase Ste14